MSVKQAMLRDWGSRDVDFIELTRGICDDLLRMAGVDPKENKYACVPVQGSGTFAIEAAINTLVPPGGKLLVLINGAYGRRIVQICEYQGTAHDILEWEEDQPLSPQQLGAKLAGDPSITHVAAIHCETTSGILNPIAEIAETVKHHGRIFILDAMSSFGAIEIDAQALALAAIVASANKCIEGVPGVGFAIIETGKLEMAQGNSSSLSLDLHAQWIAFKKNGQWRFTPPTHVLAALAQAIEEHKAEGGVIGRGQRYTNNCDLLIAGMKKLGFVPLLDSELQAPIIVTFKTPGDPKFNFDDFYNALRRRGFAIYPGKLTRADSFRIGCIGRIDGDDITRAVNAVKETLNELGIENPGPG